ncbi:hypothetical protein T10_5747 [Trichinella papuae]|uniref:Uncharacterized protein n=1 Tax=Trichinella papuae TaxID=268474 RepID=A0A0V1LWS2_9BILA|nr:hypothetical protein T10_5747 [Trichinella papuae]
MQITITIKVPYHHVMLLRKGVSELLRSIPLFYLYYFSSKHLSTHFVNSYL